MQTTTRAERLVLLGSALTFGLAMAAHTFIVLSERPSPEGDSGLLATTLAVGAISLLAALPLGALLRLLPRSFGRGGLVVAAMAVILAVGLVFASEQILLDVLGPDDGPGFFSTRWLWERARFWGFLFYLFTITFDLLVMFFFAIAQGVAPYVVPPAIAICCSLNAVLLTLPMLMMLRRRRQRNQATQGGDGGGDPGR